jgi:multidrug transporter EmrE-like cation transporter
MKVLESLILVTLGVLFSTLGDVFLKKGQFGNFSFFLGIFLYAVGAVFVFFVFKRIEFGSVFLIWEAVTIVVAMSIASFYFKEDFTIYRTLALIFAMTSLVLSYKN